MKMICPHCGVKGSADNSLLDRKVRCPKCQGIFEASQEVIQPIPVEAVELEQVHGHVERDPGGMTNEEEADDVLSRLLSDDDYLPGGPGLPEEDQPAGPAGVQSDMEDEPATVEKIHGTEKEDETLIIIEDEEHAPGFNDPTEETEDEQAVLDEVDLAEPAGERLAFDKNDPGAASDEFEWDDLEQPLPVKQGEGEISASQEGDPEHHEDPQSGKETADGEFPGEEDEGEWIPGGEDREEQPGDDDLSAPGGQLKNQEEDPGQDVSMVRKCSACDEYVDPASNYDHVGNVYCSKCVPVELKKEEGMAAAAPAAAADDGLEAEPGRFTISTLIKDAWHYSKGVKGAIWAGMLVMYLLLIGIGTAAVAVLPEIVPEDGSIQPLLIESFLQFALSCLYFLFTAGMIMIAVHKIARRPYSWKMIFSGFSRFGSLLLLFILQFIMLVIGFLLFILPGIYLAVGYILAIPLVFEKNLPPWQALEVSRLAVHKRWWTVFFSLTAMSILMTISAIPMGLGLIWTIPMFIVLIGVLYHHFFGADEE